MADYKNFNAEDFLQDDFFIAWVLHPTQVENDFWEQWLSDFPGRKVHVDQARTILLAIRIKPVSPPVTDADVHDVMTFVSEHGYRHEAEERRPVRSLFMSWLKVAVVLFVVSAGALLFYTQYNQPKFPSKDAVALQWIAFTNKSGQCRVIRMADSSVAVLQPNSSLRYPNAFLDSTRDVFLEGEAFFEVHENAARPFLVHSGDMVTKVLGTSFRVRAFAKEKSFKVVVNTGKVMVFTKQPAAKAEQRSVLVLPHQQVVLEREQVELVKDTVMATMLLAKETAQKEFSFNKATIPEVIEKLEAAYHVKITYNSRQFDQLTVTASLSDLPLDEKVKMLCKAVGATCSFSNHEITIRKN